MTERLKDFKDIASNRFAEVNGTGGALSNKTRSKQPQGTLKVTQEDQPPTPFDCRSEVQEDSNLINNDELLILHTNAAPEATINRQRTTPRANRIEPITENSIETSDIPWLGSTHPLDEWNDSEEYDDHQKQAIAAMKKTMNKSSSITKHGVRSIRRSEFQKTNWKFIS